MAKRALLIGIDEYADPADNLAGCGNDVAAMKAALTAGFGFEDGDVTTLLEPKETTHDAILEAMDTLAGKTEKDDVVLVYYSGHGSQFIDRGGDEEDHRDETIVPFDGRSPGEEPRDIVDDELHEKILEIAARTEYLSLIFDSCHSGTMTRGIAAAGEEGPFRSRELPSRRVAGAGRGKKLGAPSQFGLIPVGEYLMIGACLDAQKSKETAFDGVDRGVLSYHLEKELVANPTASLKAIFERVKKQVEDSGAGQTPVIDGPPRLRDAIPLSGPGAPKPDPIAAAPAAADGKEEKEEDEGPLEWDEWFARRAAAALFALATLVVAALGVFAWWVVDDGVESADIALITILSLFVSGFVLAGIGAYIGLLEARGRARAVNGALSMIKGTRQRDAGLAGIEVGKELKGILEAIGNMPTARALIAIGGIALGAATAFAWHVVPTSGESLEPPQIIAQPQARTTTVDGTTVFRVGAEGPDLKYSWELDGEPIDREELNRPTYPIEDATLEENGDLYAVVISNDDGEVTSEEVALTVTPTP